VDFIFDSPGPAIPGFRGRSLEENGGKSRDKSSLGEMASNFRFTGKLFGAMIQEQEGSQRNENSIRGENDNAG
jgi:hypothetical protein